MPFSINFLLDFTAHTRSIVKVFTSMNLRNGSFLKPRSSCFIRYKTLGYRLVSLYLIKHSCSFIKQNINHRLELSIAQWYMSHLQGLPTPHPDATKEYNFGSHCSPYICAVIGFECPHFLTLIFTLPVFKIMYI